MSEVREELGPKETTSAELTNSEGKEPESDSPASTLIEDLRSSAGQKLELPCMPNPKSLSIPWIPLIFFCVGLSMGFWCGYQGAIWSGFGSFADMPPDVALLSRFIEIQRLNAKAYDTFSEQAHQILRDFYAQARAYWLRQENALREQHQSSLEKMRKAETEILGTVYAVPWPWETSCKSCKSELPGSTKKPTH